MSDLDRYPTDEMIEQGREALTLGIMGCGQCCGDNPPDELDHLDFDVARAHVAARATLEAVLPDIIQQAKAEALREAAQKYQWGGWARNPQARGDLEAKSRQAEHAVKWLRDRADRIEQGGQP